MNSRSHYLLSFLALSLFASFSPAIRAADSAEKPSWSAHTFSTKNRLLATSTLLVATPVVLALTEIIKTTHATTPVEKKKTEYYKKLALAALKNARSAELWQRNFAAAYAITKCFSARGAKETRKAWAIRVKKSLTTYAKTNPALTVAWSLWIGNIMGTAVHQTYLGACSAKTVITDVINSLKPKKPSPVAQTPPPVAPPVVNNNEEVDPIANLREQFEKKDRNFREENRELLNLLDHERKVKALTAEQIALALKMLKDPTATEEKPPVDTKTLKKWLEDEAKLRREKLEKRGKVRILFNLFKRKQQDQKTKTRRTGKKDGPNPQATARDGDSIELPLVETVVEFFNEQRREGLKNSIKTILEAKEKSLAALGSRGAAHAGLVYAFPVNPLNAATYYISIPLHALLALDPENNDHLDRLVDAAIGSAKIAALGTDLTFLGVKKAWKGCTAGNAQWVAVSGARMGWTVTKGTGWFAWEMSKRTTTNMIVPALQWANEQTGASTKARAAGTFVKDKALASAQGIGRGAIVCGNGTIACGSRSGRGAARAWRAARATFTKQNITQAVVHGATGTARAGWWSTKKLAAGSWWLVKKDADFLATQLGLKTAARKTTEAAVTARDVVTAVADAVRPVTTPVGSALSRFTAFMLSGKNRKSNKLKPS